MRREWHIVAHKPSASVRIDYFIMLPGEALTAMVKPTYGDMKDWVQIELRVTKRGEIQLFCDKEVEAREFKEWWPI
jgi:hypothetical protein